MIDIIRLYNVAVGQRMNPAKSSIMFGNDVDVQIRAKIKLTIGISTEGGMGTYLDLLENIQGSNPRFLPLYGIDSKVGSIHGQQSFC